MAGGGRTLRFALVEDLFLIVHAPVDPDPRDWSLLMLESHASVHRVTRVLVSSADTKLTARQRGELGDFIKNHECQVAVLVDSAVTRGIVTALGWVTGKYRAFPSDDVEGALEYLRSRLDSATVRDEIRLMRKEMQHAQAAAG